MITDNEKNLIYLSSWLKKSYPAFFTRFTELLDNLAIPYILLSNTNDVWCRDYMPIQLDETTFLHYQYTPDYLLKNEKDKQYITDPTNILKQLKYKCIDTDIILDGGNLVISNNCVIMTEKIFQENPRYEQKQLIEQLEKLFKAEVILLPWDKVEIYGHSDGIVKFIDNDTVLITNYHDFNKEIASQIEDILKAKFKVEKLIYDVAITDERSWSYINYLEIGDHIILPALNIAEDQQALNQIKALFSHKHKNIVQIDASEIIADGGALNCITWSCKDYNNKLLVNQKRFISLLNRFSSEEEINSQFYNDKKQLPFLDEEIIFMWEFNSQKFSEKYPEIAEYYMQCLST